MWIISSCSIVEVTRSFSFRVDSTRPSRSSDTEYGLMSRVTDYYYGQLVKTNLGARQ